MRTKKAIINTFAGLLYEAVALVCGMILPRLILRAFGSSYNGITTSITQFLSVIALLRSGIGGVTRAALYKPLSEKNTMEISRILRATEIFMRRVAIIFVGFLVVFAFIYPVFVNDEFEWIFSATLVLILGISTFTQYYFGFTYQMLLNADQRQCVTSFVQIFTTILNTAVAAVLIKFGAGIHAVKLGSAVCFALNPMIISTYTKRKYKIISGVEPDNKAISQRWDAFAHQVANFVNSNTDVMVLTVFTNIREVSVYSVYYLVINGLMRLLRNSIPGVAAAFGDMIAKGQTELIGRNFRLFELVVYSLSTILFVTCGIMLVPFVMIYTSGVYDVDYQRPLFAVLISIAAFFGCARIPYQHVVEAAGHYKQTKKGAFIEAILNITLSVVSVFKFGLIGVSVGTLAATFFRTVQYATYLSKNIIKRSYWQFLKHIIISVVIALSTYFIYTVMPISEMKNYYQWAKSASICFVVVLVLQILFNLVFYHEDSINLLIKLSGMFKRRKTNEAIKKD